MKVLAVVMVIVGVSVAYLALIKKQTIADIWNTFTSFFTPSATKSTTAATTSTTRPIVNGMTHALSR